MILLVQFGIRQKFPRACLITPKFYCLSSFMMYHCLILKISQKGEKVVMKLPVGKSQWRKLRAFMVKVKKGIKTVLWGLRVLWSIRQKFWLPLKFYPQHSTNIYTVGIERVAQTFLYFGTIRLVNHKTGLQSPLHKVFGRKYYAQIWELILNKHCLSSMKKINCRFLARLRAYRKIKWKMERRSLEYLWKDLYEVFNGSFH